MLKSLLIAVALVLSGCAAVPMADQAQDQRAKTFAVAPGKANIYVYRNELLGAAIKMNVTLDGKVVGSTGARTYLALEVEPGRHTLTSIAESDATLDLTTTAGKNYFVWQEVKMGLLSARSRLQLVDEAKGRADVADCQLVDTASPMSATPASAQPPAVAPAASAGTSEGASEPPAAAPTPAASTAEAATAPTAVAPTPPAKPVPMTKPVPTSAAQPRGTFEFEAERTAMAAGCKQADGARPTAVLQSKHANIETYTVTCGMSVSCESGMCRATR